MSPRADRQKRAPRQPPPVGPPPPPPVPSRPRPTVWHTITASDGLPSTSARTGPEIVRAAINAVTEGENQ